MKQNRYPLCIVGGGPNALYLIERILAHKLEEPTEFEEFEIHVFDKGGHFGSGCHYSSQPKTNHLNRIAAQISFGADPTNTQDVKYLLPESLQWTLFDWCAARFEQTGEERFKIAEHSWVDRALFGEASEAVFEIYIERLRRLGIRCTLHKAEVTDIVPEEGAYTVHYSTADLFSHLTAEFLVLCTGHGSNQTAHGAVDAIRQAPRIDQIYPLEQLDGSVLPSNSTVACKGLGLAAIDLMLFLTEGRGGYFAVKLEDKRELVYHPSSFEPAAIIPFSGSGAFPMTRAKNQKLNNDDLMHKSIFLTYDAIDHMRDVAGRSATIDHVGPKRQLDFEAHILPIMIAEMALVFYGVLFGRDWRERTVQSITPIYNTYLLDCASIRDLQDGLARLHDPVQALARQTATDLQAFIQGNAPATPNFADTARAFVKFVRGAEALDELPNPADVSQFPKAVARELSKPSQWEHDPNPANHRFDWFELVDPLAAYAKQSLAKRREAATARFQWDLRQAEQGNLDNPTKSAIDGVCRDIRSVLRYAVEFGGLTAQSQNVFATNYQRLLNRLAVGTSMKVMKKIFALAENGVVDLAFSRSPSVTAHDDANWEISHAEPCERVQVSLLLNARVHMFNLATEESDLYQNLRKRGLVRNWRNPSDTDSDFVAGGLDILPKRNLLVRQDGQVNTSMAALGVPTEGAHYFHLAAQRPFCSDPIVVDAAAVLAEIQRHRTECAAKHETGDAFHA